MVEVTRTIEITAPPSTVWTWFTSQQALRRWLSPDLDIDLTVGGAYRMHGPDGTPVSGVVLDLVPEGRLVLSWTEDDAGWTHPARLLLQLDATPTGTRVTLVHDGFAGIGTPGWRSTAQAYERGADEHHVLDQLAAAVTTGA